MCPHSTAIRGRVIHLETGPSGYLLTIRNQEGIHRPPPLLPQVSDSLPRLGDIVSIEDGRFTILTATLHEGPGFWMDQVLSERRQRAIRARTQVETGIRDFFLSQGFLETRTPLLVRSPGMEIHIRPFELTTGAYLPTSPEFAMKRLLVGGLEKIFQITPAFRYEPNSRTHSPEFTMLEWYRAYSDLQEIQEDTEKLVEFLAIRLHGKPVIHFQGQTLSVKTPWPRFRVRDLFKEHLGFDLGERLKLDDLRNECDRLQERWSMEDTWDDLYFRLFLNHIEPRLPTDQAVFVMGYPPSQAALAVIETDRDGTRWAKRFEAYLGGIELANAFEELTNAREQRARFIADMEERTKIYGDRFPPSPIDEDFLHALEEGMPPSGGIALGVDRLIMLLADEPDIHQTFWLPAYPGAESVPPAI